jgi:hypothetical protein
MEENNPLEYWILIKRVEVSDFRASTFVSILLGYFIGVKKSVFKSLIFGLDFIF